MPQRAKDIPPEEVIVTARMSPVARTRLDSSYAVTHISDDAIEMSGALSAADLLKAVPGLWVEASGGEASNNIRARGIPRDGFASLGVFEDGLPLQHDPGLGYLNADQSFRIDETLQAVEVVRGGPSSVFASNALGGLINLVPRTPPEHFEARLKVETGDDAYRRLDAWFGGLVGDWRIAAGGFYRADDGPRPTGYPADAGGEFRITALRPFADGQFEFDYKHLDDKVAFYLPVPLQFGPVAASSRSPLQRALRHAGRPRYRRRHATGRRGPSLSVRLSKGTVTRLDQYTVKWRHSLGNGTFEESLRYRQSTTWRNGLFPDLPDPASVKLAPYLAAAQAIYPQTDHLGLAYVDTGAAFPSSGPNTSLVIDATLSSVHVPLNELINDTRYEGAVGDHRFTVGAYAAQVDMSFQQLTATTLLEVADHARRLNVVAYNAAGQALGDVTSGGITRYGAQFASYSGHEQSTAVYGTDEWPVGLWRADIGVRLEHLAVSDTIEGSQTVQGPDPAYIGDKLRTDRQWPIYPRPPNLYRRHGLAWPGAPDRSLDPALRAADAHRLFARHHRHLLAALWPRADRAGLVVGNRA